jgi:hypothetical protein
MTEAINKPKDNVIFDASFECANLDQARQRSGRVYDLFMRNDTNGQGEMQWFYFRMRNNYEGECTINIVNFTKTKSLFQTGMRPSFWSMKLNQEEGTAWY